MITYISNKSYAIVGVANNAVSKNLVEIACLSTDDKPTENIVTGSLALEVDTGDIYAFDEAGTQWTKMNG